MNQNSYSAIKSPLRWQCRAIALIALLGSFTLSSLTPSLRAAGTTVRSLAPSEAIAIALKNNPDLQVAELEIARANARVRWSGRLDNPELEITAADDTVGLGDDERTLEIAFSQSFPLTSRLHNETEVRRAQVLLAEAEIAEQRRQLAYQVDQACTLLMVSRAKLSVSQKLVQLNSEIVDFMRPLVEKGEASPLDVTQVELTNRSLQQNIGSLKNAERQQSLHLAKLLGIDPDIEVRIKRGLQLPLTQPTPPKLSNAELFRRRPDHLLTLARHDVAAAEALLADAGRWEDISVKLFVEREQAVDAPDGLERNTFTGIGVSIPLPIRQRNEEAIEQARIDTEAAEKSRAAREFNIRSEYEAALHAARDAHVLAAEASGTVIELAEKNLADFRSIYEQGQASLLQVQRAQEQLLELHNASLAFVEDYHLSEARLRFVTGNYPRIQPPVSSTDK